MKTWMEKASQACVIVLALASCGRRSSAPELELDPRASQGEEAPRDGLAVSGILGTLSQDEIQRGLEPRMHKFSRCVSQRWSSNEWLSGELELSFRVAQDGLVSSVVPTRSSFGDRAAERCMIDVAKSTRFPPPHGGDAEFSWPLEVALDASVQQPLELDPQLTGEALSEQLGLLRETCQIMGVTITLYINQDGKVITAGAVAQTASPEQLDCVADGAVMWAFPPPGTAVGKVTLTLP